MDRYKITRIDGTEIEGFAHDVTDIGCRIPRGWNVLHRTAGWVFVPSYRITSVEKVA